MNLAGVKPRVDVGIITIREDEFRAVLEAFPTAINTVRGRRIYELRSLERDDGRPYVIAVVRAAEQGNTAAQAVANDLLNELAPRWLLVVGIAGGRPADELALGDVVVSTRIVDYTVGAALPGGVSEVAHGGGPLSPEAERVVANLPARDRELGAWGATILCPRPAQDGRAPRFVTGAILASDLLMRDPERLRAWLGSARQVLACEMESAGVYRVTHDRGVPFLAIRGISDVVGIPRNHAWTAYAAASAAAFARAFLRMGPIPVEGQECMEPTIVQQQPARAGAVFVFYADEDVEYLTELEAHLAPIVRTCHLGLVAPRGQWGDDLRTKLEAAQIIVVLLSASLLTSKQCCEVELRHAFNRAAFGQARIIPVMLRPCLWPTEPYTAAPIFPDSGVPLCYWHRRDDAWVDLAGTILETAREFDARENLMAERQRTFFRTPTNCAGFSFVRVCVDSDDDHWGETPTPLIIHPSPFGAGCGQYVFLKDLFYVENDALGLNLDVTIMNQSTVPLVLTKIGIEIIGVAQIPDGYGDGVPTKVRKMDSYVLELPDVRAMLNDKFPGLESWERKGPVTLDLLVPMFLPDPVLIPAMTPYRYGLLLESYTEKMPNHSLIRAWALTSVGDATSTCLDVFTS